jgi:hypothetical protein
MDLGNRPNFINPNLTNKIIDGEHIFADMPYYTNNSQAENIFFDRYKELIDTYARTFNTTPQQIDPNNINKTAIVNLRKAQQLEADNIPVLIELCEKIVREQYNLDEDEVTFDLEIVKENLELPDSINKSKKISPRFRQSQNLDVIKKRTINALSQGASKKSHYIFHLYKDEFESIAPGITDNYNKAFVCNDFSYFTIDDDMFMDFIDKNTSSNAGYSEIKFVDGKPVIVAKSVCAMLLIHEMTKGVISLLSIPGIQDMSQKVIDDTDFIAAELWDLRFGPKFWEEFHSIIDPDDYDIKKLIIMQLFNLPSDEFVTFFDNVLNNKDLAQKEVSYIVKKIRRDILDYNMNTDYNE